MSANQILVLIMLVCIGLIVAGTIFNKPDILVKVMARCVLGVIAIYFTNQFLGMRDIDTGVGINIFTGAAMGLLGAPGYVLLYAMAFIL